MTGTPNGKQKEVVGVGGFMEDSAQKQVTTRSRIRFSQWLDEQLGLKSLRYEIPDHAQRIYSFLGGITLGGLGVLFLSGFYLVLFYDPAPAEARNSVVYLITSVGFGEFVRSVHLWAANLVLVTAGLHLARVFITGSYKRPRQLNWVVGVGLFLLILTFYFSGTVLKWDQEGYEALGHIVEVAKLIGGWIGALFTGNFALSLPLLTRFSFLHVAILPVTLVLFTVLHLLLMKHHGISPLPFRSERAAQTTRSEEKQRFSHFDVHLRMLFGYSMLLTALILLLSLAVPARLGVPVIQGREITKPIFFFWSLVALENRWGIKALLWAAVIIPVALLAVPFIDRTPLRHILNRKWSLLLGILVVVAVVALTVLGGLTPTGTHIE